MSEEKKIDHQEYEGTGKFISAVGRGAVETAVGGAAGAAVGAGIGAVIGKNSQSLQQLSKDFSSMSGGQIKIGPKGLGALNGAVIVGFIAGGLAAIHGLYKGYKTGKAGKEQFDAHHEVIDGLKAEVTSLKAAATPAVPTPQVASVPQEEVAQDAGTKWQDKATAEKAQAQSAAAGR